MTTLPDQTEMPLEESINYPFEGFFDSNDHTEVSSDIEEATVIGLVDTDCDGLACEYIINQAYPETDVFVFNTGEFQLSTYDALTFIGEHTDASDTVIIADLAPNEEFSSFLAGVSQINAEVRIYDHHEWTWTAQKSVENMVSSVVIGGDDVCAAQVLQQDILPDPDASVKEFLEVTADHDLYTKNDPRSDHLSTLSFTLDSDTYLSAVDTYGADLLDDPELKQTYENAETEANRRKEIAVDRARTVEINGYRVGLTYGQCHQSRVGDELLSNGCDLAVIIQPWAKVSFRSQESTPICSQLAKMLGGGGHDYAAGASIYHQYDSPSDVHHLEHLWVNNGEPALDAMEDFLQRSL